ncbi:hypothetical protein T492DRAFT_1094182 [Pavlovales sp. CCMP2436]|nr:hypothetical protein T492DRAFT_1094182 [Pavlovales sp. CCMP2436]
MCATPRHCAAINSSRPHAAVRSRGTCRFSDARRHARTASSREHPWRGTTRSTATARGVHIHDRHRARVYRLATRGICDMDRFTRPRQAIRPSCVLDGCPAHTLELASGRPNTSSAQHASTLDSHPRVAATGLPVIGQCGHSAAHARGQVWR